LIFYNNKTIYGGKLFIKIKILFDKTYRSFIKIYIETSGYKVKIIGNKKIIFGKNIMLFLLN